VNQLRLGMRQIRSIGGFRSRPSRVPVHAATASVAWRGSAGALNLGGFQALPGLAATEAPLVSNVFAPSGRLVPLLSGAAGSAAGRGPAGHAGAVGKVPGWCTVVSHFYGYTTRIGPHNVDSALPPLLVMRIRTGARISSRGPRPPTT
jgi:hypothetical protein